MYLHTMTLQALGPFAGTHTIDFAELGASGIFLLEGPTGAGKSTLIDALVFALYGKVASKDASDERLRSAHASPADETVVDLVFECGSGIYRVRRTPAYQRPKQRGSGTTLQQASVRLWRLSSPDVPEDGELLSARLDEAGLELQRIVGLDRHQFVQTVVLPQGEFAGFLRAKPEDRRGLLQRVFGTAVYEQVEQRLVRMRAEVGRAVEERREAVARSTAHLLGAAGLAEEEATALQAAGGSLEHPDGDGRLLTLGHAHGDALDERARRARTVADQAKAACASTQQAVDEGRRQLDLLRRRTALRTELAGLEARAEEHQQEADRCAAGRRAQAVHPLITGLEQARRALTAAQEAERTTALGASADLQALVMDVTDPSVRRKTLGVERDRCTTLRGSLDRLVTIEHGLPARRAEVAAAQAARVAQEAERDRLAQQVAARPALRKALEEELAEVRAVAARLGAAHQRVELAQSRLRAAREVVDLAATLAAAEHAVTEAAAAATAAVEKAAQTQQARIAGIAGELARGLEAGDPCAVCGSTEHPAPAPLDPEHVTPEAVEAAEARRLEAQQNLETASTARSQAREQLGARTAAAEGLDVEQAQAALDAVRTEVATAQAATDRTVVLERKVQEHDGETRRLEAHVHELGTQIATHVAEAASLSTQITTDEAEVNAAREGAPTVHERVTALDGRIRTLTAWIDALAEVEDRLTQEADRTDELSAGLADHGFTDADTARAAHLPAAELATLDAEVARYRSALERVTTGLAEPEVRELPEQLEIDLDALLETHQVADTAATQAAAEAARLEDRATSTARALAELIRAVEAYREVALEAEPVVRMANLASASGGDNAKRLTLGTFVLVRRFEDVVAAANARLVSMSSGRFELVRSEEREAVRSLRTGLAMKVIDHRTETERDPRTLSGGETFYVSLCLALGLADVVTAEAGGIDLGTLFVDEGFGSLDPETLDVVLAELGRLRDGGRIVGVVSHVEQLKQSIAERIEVRRLPNGASTLTVRA